ncbi:MAG TPA: hypothetical protein VNY32_06160, partial [Candidatus Acidoferrales bacterium]|nr:hypothetical protein [Candidatus Acidoferrales bacterium]
KPLPAASGGGFCFLAVRLQPKIFAEIFNRFPVLRPGLPRLNRELEHGLFRSQQEGFNVGARRNSPQRS